MNGNNNFFWFETNKIDKHNYLSYYFQNPIKIIRLDDPEDTDAFFLSSRLFRKNIILPDFSATS